MDLISVSFFTLVILFFRLCPQYMSIEGIGSGLLGYACRFCLVRWVMVGIQGLQDSTHCARSEASSAREPSMDLLRVRGRAIHGVFGHLLHLPPLLQTFLSKPGMPGAWESLERGDGLSRLALGADLQDRFLWSPALQAPAVFRTVGSSRSLVHRENRRGASELKEASGKRTVRLFGLASGHTVYQETEERVGMTYDCQSICKMKTGMSSSSKRNGLQPPQMSGSWAPPLELLALSQVSP